MGAPDPENPLFLGLSVPRGGFRPWSQTMVSEGARPWGRVDPSLLLKITSNLGALKGTELRWQREPKTQIFAENRWFSQVHPFSWKFKHLEGAGFSQKTADFRRKTRKQAEYGFGEHGFTHRTQWVFLGAHWVPGSELSEFLSAYYLCAKTNSPRLPQNSPSLPQNSPSFSEISRNSIPPVSYIKTVNGEIVL